MRYKEFKQELCGLELIQNILQTEEFEARTVFLSKEGFLLYSPPFWDERISFLQGGGGWISLTEEFDPSTKMFVKDGILKIINFVKGGESFSISTLGPEIYIKKEN